MLDRLRPPRGSTKRPIRVGRGESAGKGKTCGRGHKGQGARSGGGAPRGFEGGQMPMQRRLPKRGFTNIFKKQFCLVKLRDLERFEEGSVVDEEALRRSGLVRKVEDGIKVLGDGELTRRLTVRVQRVSKSAREKIEAAGGTVEEPRRCGD